MSLSHGDTLMDNPTRTVLGYPANVVYPHPPCSAYPCAVPLPQSYPYNPQHATFLRRFIAIVVASVVITTTTIFIIWLVLRPRIPHFQVDTFSRTSPFNLTSDRLSTSWVAALTARNPNGKITLYYDHVEAAVFYRGESLAETYLAPFVQGSEEESEVKASFVVANSLVDSDDVGRMNEEIGRGNGNIGFSVRIVADVRFKVGIWRARRRLFNVYCGDLAVSVSGNGNRSSGFTGWPRQCTVGL